MKILKRWYFEWLNERMGDIIQKAVMEQLSKHNFKEDIDYWVKHHAQSNIQYTHFISAIANNPQLIDGIVDSINRKQLK